MKSCWFLLLIVLLCLFVISSCKKKEPDPVGVVQLTSIKIGSALLNLKGENMDVTADSSINILFDHRMDTTTVRKSLILKKTGLTPVAFNIKYSSDFSLVKVIPVKPLENTTSYLIQITSEIKGQSGETFPGAECSFITINGKIKIEAITLNGIDFRGPAVPRDVSWETVTFNVRFSEALDTTNYKKHFYLTGNIPLAFVLSADQKSVSVTNSNRLTDITKYTFAVLSTLKARNGFTFDGFQNDFFTKLDSTPKFPVVSDDELLTLIQQRTFRYFYDFAQPASGMTRERNNSGDLVTTGGSGFGIMALVVGMNRNFITRSEGLTRMNKIVNFLEKCDRFHGAWPHWLNGTTGKVIPFTPKDNGGDLVETSFMIQGLLTMRQYLDPGLPAEKDLIDRITVLVNGVEYDWYTRGRNVLYWHWSPDYGWAMNMQLSGYNETLITYVVAAASTSHSIPAAAYHQGYARNGDIRNGNSYYGYVLPLGERYGGPLFFTHYSFLGLDPRNLADQYASYMQQNVNQSLINWSYCRENPKKFIGYSSDCWGLTACDNPWGYAAHSPTNDLGVIASTAAISALPFTPEQSMKAIHQYYYLLGDRLLGDFGFYDSFDITEGWWASSYLAIDQGPIICMIENYRSGLLWHLFMSNPEINDGLTKLGFTH
jgi:hypothetical protein